MPSSAPAHVSVLVGCAEFVWPSEIPLKSAGFLTVGFSAEVEVIFSTKFLKDSVVWTGLCVAPAFMLSFSCWVAMSAAKYFLFF